MHNHVGFTEWSEDKICSERKFSGLKRLVDAGGQRRVSRAVQEDKNKQQQLK